jgi:hypothetical protein
MLTATGDAGSIREPYGRLRTHPVVTTAEATSATITFRYAVPATAVGSAPANSPFTKHLVTRTTADSVRPATLAAFAAWQRRLAKLVATKPRKVAAFLSASPPCPTTPRAITRLFKSLPKLNSEDKPLRLVCARVSGAR